MKGLRSLGPALIVASVVLGPGSILTSSKVGAAFGYELVWVIGVAALLMASTTALSARLGVTSDRTLCAEIAARAGRGAAVFVGVVLFLVVACFQFSNNVSVVAAIEPFWPMARGGGIWVVVGVNVLVCGALFGMRGLYLPIERLMKVLVGLMLLGFVANAIYARPSIRAVLEGLVPGLPAGVELTVLPAPGQADPLLPVVGLFGTTFSVAGAFYQSYLVRTKGWTERDLTRGMVDSWVGIGVLGFLTATILVTAASVLHGRVAADALASTADVAKQLDPLFGPAASVLFAVGLFAGAFSSFLVNAMIGGLVLSDGLGLGGDMEGRWPRLLTVVALVFGMSVSLFVLQGGGRPVQLIVFAQAMTVLGNPVLAGVLLWFAWRPGRGVVPRWLRLSSVLAFLAVLLVALRTAVRVLEGLSS